MMLSHGGRVRAVTLVTIMGAGIVLPSATFAQQAVPPPPQSYSTQGVRPTHGRKALDEAMQAANLRPDQQAHIRQLVADERARAKTEPDKSARKALKHQLKRDILATMDPNQQAAFESALRQIKAERKAEKAGLPPAPQ